MPDPAAAPKPDPTPEADPHAPPPLAPVPLATLFRAFAGIGMASFGGGLSGWMRQEIVHRRGWLTDRQFLSGLALSQISPGANAVNLSVFIGTTLRGLPGMAAALAGLMGLPIVIILIAGALLASGPPPAIIDRAFIGLGCAAIGLTLATGVRMARRNLRGLKEAAIAVVVAIGIGALRWPLLPTLVVMIPLSWLLLRRPPAPQGSMADGTKGR